MQSTLMMFHITLIMCHLFEITSHAVTPRNTLKFLIIMFFFLKNVPDHVSLQIVTPERARELGVPYDSTWRMFLTMFPSR
jgi:hypothetical protein